MKTLILLALLINLFNGYSASAAPDFPRARIELAGKQIMVELADNDERREYGLMNRRVLAAQEGMLFVFDSEQSLVFWMKDTLIPLSIGYFDENRRLVDKQEMVPAIPMARKPVLYPSAKKAKYALEMNKDWFIKNKINLGQVFTFVTTATKPKPSVESRRADSNTASLKTGSAKP